MSIEHDITYKWTAGSTSIPVTRAIVSDNGGSLDLAVATGTYNLPATFALVLAKAKSIFLTSDQPVILRAGGVNAVQSLTITGTPTGGGFTLTLGGNTTASIAYNATAAAVASALNLLASVGASGVTATGGPLPGTPVAITFGGLNAAQVVASMTATNSLTGGTSPALVISTTTAGVAPDTTLNLLANVPLVWDAAGYYAQPFAADLSVIRVTNTSGVGANLKLRTLASA